MKTKEIFLINDVQLPCFEYSAFLNNRVKFKYSERLSTYKKFFPIRDNVCTRNQQNTSTLLHKFLIVSIHRIE